MNSEIKNNLNVISKNVSKTDAEWFDLMELQAERSLLVNGKRKPKYPN